MVLTPIVCKKVMQLDFSNCNVNKGLGLRKTGGRRFEGQTTRVKVTCPWGQIERVSAHIWSHAESILKASMITMQRRWLLHKFPTNIVRGRDACMRQWFRYWYDAYHVQKKHCLNQCWFISSRARRNYIGILFFFSQNELFLAWLYKWWNWSH